MTWLTFERILEIIDQVMPLFRRCYYNNRKTLSTQYLDICLSYDSEIQIIII